MKIRFINVDYKVFSRVNEMFGCGGWYIDHNIHGDNENGFMIDFTLAEDCYIKATEKIYIHRGAHVESIDGDDFEKVVII